jgi:hypothetical protein
LDSPLLLLTLMRHSVALLFIGGAALMLGGCAGTSKHIVAPSTVGSNKAIAGASESNRNAQRQNDIARGTAERIEAKAAVVRKYWDTSK